MSDKILEAALATNGISLYFEPSSSAVLVRRCSCSTAAPGATMTGSMPDASSLSVNTN